MKRKLLVSLLPTISLATIVPLTIVPVVATSKSNLTSKTEAAVASINDVTVTFTSAGQDLEGNAISSGITLTGNLTQKIRKNKEFMMLKTPTASLANAEFSKWQYSTDGSTWNDANPGTKISANMTIRPVFDITACNKFFVLDTTVSTGKQYKALQTSSLCGDGAIYLEDGTTKIADRSAFNQEIYIGKKVTSIPDDFLSSCASLTKRIDFSGATQLTYIGANFLSDCTEWMNGVTGTAYNLDLSACTQLRYIDDSFLANCEKFTLKIILPEGLTKIGNEFLFGCTTYMNMNATEITDVSPLILPSTLTSIGSSFMEGCEAYGQGMGTAVNCITIPSNVSHVGEAFMYKCKYLDNNTITINCSADSFTESDETLARTDAAWTTGITISGTTEIITAFKALFPNSSTSPYRTLN